MIENNQKQNLLPEQDSSMKINATDSEINQTIDEDKKDKYEIEVLAYDELCESYSRIIKVIPIKKSIPKIILLVLLNLITAFLIDLFLVWFPSLRLGLIYSKTDLKNATKFVIYGTDKSMWFINAEKINLPKLGEESFLKREYKTNIPEVDQLIGFTFKLFKYIYLPEQKGFSAIQSKIDTTFDKIHKICAQGLNEVEYKYQKELYGVCDLDIEVKNFFQILVREFTDPFYIFQVGSIVLWFFNEYEAYAALIIVATLFSLLESTYETRKNLLQIQKLAKYSCEINVYRKDEENKIKIIPINSRELVPGDLFEVQEENKAMPCDCILIKGTTIINEAMLTGESTPIIKNGIQETPDKFDLESEKKKFLFAGTSLVQKRTHKNEKVLGLVYSTGFNTSKGNLIRSILYPKEVNFKFKEDSVKYIIVMAILSLFGFAISFPFLLQNNTVPIILMKSLDLITTTVPPALPACIGIGISYALSRLKAYGILCINRERMNLCGKVNMICFDKTGTLTEDHLDIYGYVATRVRGSEFVFGNFQKNADHYEEECYKYYKAKIQGKLEKSKSQEVNQLFVECLATCHCATLLKGNIIGDPIDVKMFESSKWNLFETGGSDSEASETTDNEEKTEENPKKEEVVKSQEDSKILTYVRPQKEPDLKERLQNLQPGEDDLSIIKEHYELGVVRRFDFSSKLQRMSVIAKNENEEYYKIFVKGSPEKIKELCLERTIPKDFNDQLTKYTSKGLRVLAMGVKRMKMTYLQTQQIIRDQAETDLIFLGLILVQNKLKEATTPTIENLDRVGIKMAMATGDNLLTAICVSRDCKLIKPDAIVHNIEIEGDSLVLKTIDNFNDAHDIVLHRLSQAVITSADDNINEEKGLRNSKDEGYTHFRNSLLCNYIEEGIIEEDQELYERKRKLSGGGRFSVLLPLQEFVEEANIPKECKVEVSKREEANIDDNLIYDKIEKDDIISEEKQEQEQQEEEESSKKKEIQALEIENIKKKEEEEERANVHLNVNIETEDLKYSKEALGDHIIGITGTTFETLYNLKNEYKQTQNPDLQVFDLIFKNILYYGCVFARMAPEHKAILVECLRNENLSVLMCGDGANDCGALRAADIGVSLSPEEASIAAHFTSNVADISCLIKLLREGKASLVTSLQTFKYMMIYSLVQFISVTLLMVLNSYLTDWQFLITDIFIIFPLEFLMARTKAYKELTPQRPTDSLISFPIISSILIQTLIAFIFQYGGYLTLRHGYKYYEDKCGEDDNWGVFTCQPNTVIYVISNMQYLITAYSFSISKPFKRPIYTNFPLVGFIIFGFAFSVEIIVFPDPFFGDLLQIDELKQYFRFIVLGFSLFNFILSELVERFLIPCLSEIHRKRNLKKLTEKVNEQGFNANLADLMKVASN